MVMSPGTYIRKRRLASGHTLPTLALAITAMPEARGPLSQRDLGRLHDKLAAIERDRDRFGPHLARLLTGVLRFDPTVYAELLDLHDAGLGSFLPVPQVCRYCGCTWTIACVHPDPRTGHPAPCNWSAHDPELCTACERLEPAHPERSRGTAALVRPIREGAPL